MRRLLLAVIASAVLSIAASAASARNDAQSGPTGRIAYSVRHWPKNASENWEIFLKPLSASSSTNLTRNPRSDEITPAWSHDGEWIAFAGFLGRPSGIYVIRTDGSGRRPVVRLPRRVVDDPAWAPDDRTLAFAYARFHFRPGGTGVWTVGVDGQGLRRLTRGRDGSPTWSPNGLELAFDRRRGEQSDVFRIRADRTGQRRIAMSASGPVWSPDGRTIAFIRNGDAWLMSPDGGSQRRLARVRGPNGVSDLAWSPDGRYLAFYVSCCRESGIYVIGADGTGRRRLSYGPEQLGIAWGPDS